ncbi:MAG: hypothetical protein MKZ95_09765, partial [Pirellulales bacterium]|nr:hypothetical protein [Pirellulales bacterium]
MLCLLRNWGCILGCVFALLPRACQAVPSVVDALKQKPVQDGIQIDHPTSQEVGQCTIKAE